MSLQSRWTMGLVIVWECNKRFLSNTQGKNRYKYGEKNAQCFYWKRYKYGKRYKCPTDINIFERDINAQQI